MKVTTLFLILTLFNLSAFFPPPGNLLFDVIQGVDPTSGLTTTEAGNPDTFNISLDSMPGADVTIDLASSDESEGTVSPTTVVFTSSDWDQPKTITVTGVNDNLDDGDISYTIQTLPAESTDPNFNGLDLADVTVTNTDDDTAGITVTPTDGLTTSENLTTAQFTIVLNSEPTANVTIGLSSSDTTEGIVSPTSVEFTNTNWDDPQPVTVTGVNDDIDDGNISFSIVTANAVSIDGNYFVINPEDVGITNTDNDTAGIIVNPTSGLTTSENLDTDSFTIVLTSEPVTNIVIPVSSLDTTEGTVSPGTVTFTPDNWDSAQTVTIIGVNDDLDDGNTSYTIQVGSPSSGDANYLSINPDDVSVTNTDNDTAGIIVNPTSGLTTTENGTTAQFTIVLNSEPTANVTIGLSSSDTTEGTVSPTSVEFTNTNWDDPQPVTVTGVNDFVIDGNISYTIITSTPTTTDPIYAVINPPDVNVTNTDNDSAGITVTPVSGLITTENGTTAQFTIVLNSEPTASVTIGLSSSDTTEGTVLPVSVSFDDTDWNITQTVTITGVNDDVDDGDKLYSIITEAAISTDVNYSGRDASDVSVTNTDNDTAGITIIPTTGLETTEGGGTDQFTVVLNSKPSASVSIDISSSTPSEGTVSTDELIFTTENWNSEQTVTITGVDDYLNDGDIEYSITILNAVSGDTNYDGKFGVDFKVLNRDQYTSPKANNDVYNVPGNATFYANEENGILSDDEVEQSQQSTLEAILLDDVNHGSLTLNEDGSFTYIPNFNYAGVDSFLYKANDGIDDSNQTTVTLNVFIDNYPPTATDDNYQVDEDQTLSSSAPGVLNNDEDLDDDPLTAVIVGQTTNGILNLNANGSFTYTPNDNYFGTDSFTYKAWDGEFYSIEATVTITINSMNDVPIGADDSYKMTTTSTTPLTVDAPGVLENDTDVDDSSLTVVIETNPTNGTVNLTSDGGFIYTPNQDGARNDSFTYRVFDGEDYSTPVTVSIDGPPPPPSWISPVGDNGIFYVNSGNINLETTLTNPPADFSKIVYKWWNPSISNYVILGEKSSSPYSIQINTANLDPEWNQLFAISVDTSGIESKYIRILIWRDPTLQIYLPTICR